MKIFIVAFLMISAVSAHAQAYQKLGVRCVFSGVQFDNDHEPQSLPGTINVNLDMLLKPTGPIYRAITGGISYKVAEMTSSGPSYFRPKIIIRELYSLKGGKISKADAKTLLEDLGAQDVPNLPYGLNFKDHLEVGVIGARGDDSTIQFHHSEHNGLGYRVSISCR